jgi:hypothetical protein
MLVCGSKYIMMFSSLTRIQPQSSVMTQTKKTKNPVTALVFGKAQEGWQHEVLFLKSRVDSMYRS